MGPQTTSGCQQGNEANYIFSGGTVFLGGVTDNLRGHAPGPTAGYGPCVVQIETTAATISVNTPLNYSPPVDTNRISELGKKNF